MQERRIDRPIFLVIMIISRIHFLLLLFSVFLPGLVTGQESSRATAAVFTAREEPVSAEFLKKLDPDAVVKETKGKDGLRSFQVTWPTAGMKINFDPGKDQAEQNEGALGWISKFPPVELSAPGVAELQKFLPTAKRMYGIVIPKGYDEKGLTGSFLRKMAAELDGYIFAGNTFYDRAGFRLVGVPFDRPFAGRAGRTWLAPEVPQDLAGLLAGKWKVDDNFKVPFEENELKINTKSTEEYLPGGLYRSAGRVTVYLEVEEGGKAQELGFDLKVEGKWEVRDNQLIRTAGDTVTSNPRSSPQFKELLAELMEGMREPSPPEAMWVISRHPDEVLLEEAEEGLFTVMKREGTGTGKPGK